MIGPGERVLLVDDILTTGGSLLAMIPAVEAAGGEIVECAVLVDRSGRPGARSPRPRRAAVYPLRALWQLELDSYEAGPGDLPALRGGRAGRQARQQWHGHRTCVSRTRSPCRRPPSPGAAVLVLVVGLRDRARADAGPARDGVDRRPGERDAR